MAKLTITDAARVTGVSRMFRLLLPYAEGVPLHMVSKWMEHATKATTASYCNAMGEEQQTRAVRMWIRSRRVTIRQGKEHHAPCGQRSGMHAFVCQATAPASGGS